MSQAKIGRWGKNLAVRVPAKVAKAAHLSEGESVEFEVVNDGVVFRRSNSRKRAAAKAAGDAIRRDRKRIRLRGVTIRELIDEGRKY